MGEVGIEQPTTIRGIEIFKAVATYGTQSKAAEVLNLTHPAVSKQLQRLQEQIGEKLYEGFSTKELELYSDLINSQNWTIRSADGTVEKIKDAPVFFIGNEITWITI